MESDKKEIQISAPKFYEQSSHLALISRIYEEVVGESIYPQFYFGIVAALQLYGGEIPEESFPFFCTYLYHAGKERVIFDVDGSRHPIPEFDPNDPMCKDCRPLVDITLALYAFTSSLEDEIAIKDHLGGIFSYSGIGIEGVEDGYHLTKDEFLKMKEAVVTRFELNDSNKKEEFRQSVILQIKQLIKIFEKGQL